VYEGEVTELTPAETENPLSGYGKTISHVVVGLKTVKGTKQLRLDPSIYEAIQKERVVVGDVIYIEANTGAVKVSPDARMLHVDRKPDQGKSSESGDPTPTQPNSTWKPTNTCLYPRVMFTSEKNSFKTLLCMILTWRTLDRKAVRI
jgi:hypothetical protein